MLSCLLIYFPKVMKKIKVSKAEIVVPFETAILLYRLGRFDSALLANCIPQEMAKRECPEILRYPETIAIIAELLEFQEP